MVGLLLYTTFIPGPAAGTIDVLAGPTAGWLGGTELDERHRLLLVRPDGLLPDPAETLPVLVAVGPLTPTPLGLLRRLSFTVQDLAPEVRCDLHVSRARASGCRLRLHGDYRPPLGTRTDDIAEVLESVARPLVEGIVAQVGRSTLPV